MHMYAYVFSIYVEINTIRVWLHVLWVTYALLEKMPGE